MESALQVYELAGKPCNGLKIHCINRVPLGSGLGSSSAALLTGMLGANALLGEPFSREEILKLAIETEGHPDNVAPAMLGGLVASIIHESHVVSLRLTLTGTHTPIHITVVFPDFDFPTKQARALLPKQIDRRDAIYNISRAVIVTEAFRQGDLDMLAEAMTDRLHQPYRIPLIPGAQAAMDAMKEAGASAVALSGAGPSLIAFSTRRETAIGRAGQQAFAEAGLDSRALQIEDQPEGRTGLSRLAALPLLRKSQNPRPDVIDLRVGIRPALGNQLHRLLRSIPLCDQNAGSHRHAAVPPTRAVDIDLASCLDRFERRSCPGHQLGNRDGKEGAVDRPQPEQLDRLVMWVRKWPVHQAHVDEQPDTQLAQAVIVTCKGSGTDKKIVGDV